MIRRQTASKDSMKVSRCATSMAVNREDAIREENVELGAVRVVGARCRSGSCSGRDGCHRQKAAYGLVERTFSLAELLQVQSK